MDRRQNKSNHQISQYNQQEVQNMAEDKTYPKVVDVTTQTTPMLELSEGDIRDVYGCLEYIIKKINTIEKAVA